MHGSNHDANRSPQRAFDRPGAFRRHLMSASAQKRTITDDRFRPGWLMAAPTSIADPTSHQVRVAWSAQRTPNDVQCRADATTPGAADA